MHAVDEIHEFSAVNVAGDVMPLGRIAANEAPCIHAAIAAIAAGNQRIASVMPQGALEAAVDAAFSACERIPGSSAVAEAPYGRMRILCARTLVQAA